MLKTIKKKKEVRIDELIYYITMNAHKLLDGKEFYTFKSKHGTDVTIDAKGNVNLSYMLYLNDDLYTVEIEEEITEDTKFDLLVGVYFYDDVGSYKTATFYNMSIDDVKDSEFLCVYALINEKLELIWERED